jgi:hypothetical protein
MEGSPDDILAKWEIEGYDHSVLAAGSSRGDHAAFD